MSAGADTSNFDVADDLVETLKEILCADDPVQPCPSPGRFGCGWCEPCLEWGDREAEADR